MQAANGRSGGAGVEQGSRGRQAFLFLGFLAFVGLQAIAAWGFYRFDGLPHLPHPLPSWSEVLWLLQGSYLPPEAVRYTINLLGWVILSYLAMTTAFRLLIGILESVAFVLGLQGAWIAAGLARLRESSDRLTLPFAGQLVDGLFLWLLLAPTATLAGGSLGAEAVGLPAHRAPIHAPTPHIPSSSPRPSARGSHSPHHRHSLPRHLPPRPPFAPAHPAAKPSAPLLATMTTGQLYRTVPGADSCSTETVSPTLLPGARNQQLALYTVQPGDCLRSIAAYYYGSEEAWPRIFAANRDQVMNDGTTLSDPDEIYIGWSLKIPLPVLHPPRQLRPVQAPASPAQTLPQLPIMRSRTSAEAGRAVPDPSGQALPQAPTHSRSAAQGSGQPSPVLLRSLPSRQLTRWARLVGFCLGHGELGAGLLAGCLVLGLTMERRRRRLAALASQPPLAARPELVVGDDGFADVQTLIDTSNGMSLAKRLLDFLEAQGYGDVELAFCEEGETAFSYELLCGADTRADLLANREIEADTGILEALEAHLDCQVAIGPAEHAPKRHLTLVLTGIARQAALPVMDERFFLSRPQLPALVGMSPEHTHLWMDVASLSPLLIASGPDAGARVALSSLLTLLASSVPPSHLRLILAGLPAADLALLGRFPQVIDSGESRELAAVEAGASRLGAMALALQEEATLRRTLLGQSDVDTMREYNLLHPDRRVPLLLIALSGTERLQARQPHEASGAGTPPEQELPAGQEETWRDWEHLLLGLQRDGERIGMACVLTSEYPLPLGATLENAVQSRLLLRPVAGVLPALADGEALLSYGKGEPWRLRAIRIAPDMVQEATATMLANQADREAAQAAGETAEPVTRGALVYMRTGAAQASSYTDAGASSGAADKGAPPGSRSRHPVIGGWRDRQETLSRSLPHSSPTSHHGPAQAVLELPPEQVTAPEKALLDREAPPGDGESLAVAEERDNGAELPAAAPTAGAEESGGSAAPPEPAGAAAQAHGVCARNPEEAPPTAGPPGTPESALAESALQSVVEEAAPQPGTPPAAVGADRTESAAEEAEVRAALPALQDSCLPPLRLFFLRENTFQVACGHTLVRLPNATRQKPLLARLALAGKGGVDGATLQKELCGATTQRNRKSLVQTMKRFRRNGERLVRSLPAEDYTEADLARFRMSELIVHDKRTLKYRFDTTVIYCDVTEFLTAIARAEAEAKLHASPTEAATRHYEQAVALYQADFCLDLLSEAGTPADDEDESGAQAAEHSARLVDWLDKIRDDLQLKYLAARLYLGRYAQLTHRYTEAIQHYSQLLAIEPASLEAAQNLARCYMAQRQKNVALRVYTELRRIYAEDLQMPLPEETVETFEEILGRSLQAS